MTSKKDEEDVLNIGTEVDYLKTFIEVTKGWADQAQADEVHELEKLCRAAAYYTEGILNLFLSAHSEVVNELADGALSMEDYLLKIKDHL